MSTLLLYWFFFVRCARMDHLFDDFAQCFFLKSIHEGFVWFQWPNCVKAVCQSWSFTRVPSRLGTLVSKSHNQRLLFFVYFYSSPTVVQVYFGTVCKQIVFQSKLEYPIFKHPNMVFFIVFFGYCWIQWCLQPFVICITSVDIPSFSYKCTHFCWNTHI